MKRSWLLALALMVLLPPAATAMQYPGSSSRVAAYANTTPTDAIARLQQKLDSGEVKLEFEGVCPACVAAR